MTFMFRWSFQEKVYKKIIDKELPGAYNSYVACEAHVRVAQLDRASGYGPEGRGFESCHAHLKRSVDDSTDLFLYVILLNLFQLFCFFHGLGVIHKLFHVRSCKLKTCQDLL